MQWQLLHDQIPASPKELEQILLKNRGILDAPLFFSPLKPSEISLEDVNIDVEQVRLAKDRILRAIEKKEKILVFGDYDADGICATAILWETLYGLGADVLPFIPHREKHGYGLTWAALQEIYAHPLPSLLITVDTGIVAHEAVVELTGKGVDVIVTDHHQPEETLPEALAVIHTTQVCGSAVSWFTAREFDSAAADRALDLAALATISDLMPLKGANRSLVFHGLRSINASRRRGLKALIQAAGLGKRAIDAGTVGYSLAPRINAMGRLSHGLDALRLLCTKDAGRAAQLAQLVDDTNADRQQLTEDLLQLAKRQVQEQKKESLLIAFSPDFHEGVIGLIAGKLAEWYAKPAIVISTRGEVAKASARSVPGVNITELIRTAKQYLLEAGGHPMAAGFGFEPGKLNELMEYLFAYARENIDPALLQKTLNIDCPLELQQVTADLVRNIQKFAPFGQENPEPVFAFKGLRIAQVQRIGAQQQHLKLFLEGTDGTAGHLQALAWGKGEAADNLEAEATADIAGVLQLNAWRDKVSVQLIIRDVRLAESA